MCPFLESGEQPGAAESVWWGPSRWPASGEGEPWGDRSVLAAGCPGRRSPECSLQADVGLFRTDQVFLCPVLTL